MSSPLAIYKLIILYLLDKADGEIAMDRLSSFLLEKGYVNFVSLMQTYAEIEKSGLVRSRNSGDRCFYRITDCIPAENGMYNVILKVMERTDSVMEIRLQVPDKGLAEEICRRWPEKNEKIYNSLIENLF